MPQTDVLGGDTDDVSLGVDDTGSGTAGANVDSYVVIHVGVEIIVRVSGHLSGGSALSEGQRRHADRAPFLSRAGVFVRRGDGRVTSAGSWWATRQIRGDELARQ